MTVTDIPIVATARGLRSRWNGRWMDASPESRTRIQVAVFAGVVLMAYHYSLSTLMKSLSVDTPLAYLGLVPIIALGLAAVRSRPMVAEPAIYDRQVDFIIGLPLMVTAVAINVLLPRKLSAMFWVWRIDLLSFPFFVAGVAAIVFGVRALWRQRLAVAYLVLVWPVPYTVLLLRDLNAVTSITLRGLRAMLHVVHFAAPIASSDGSVFYVVHAGHSFTISVVSACSGVNGMVGFLLVGSAFGAIVTGPRLRKTMWLVGGLLLLWMFNIFRILLIFWAGQRFGEHFALKVLHPFVGLITFNLGVIVMLLLLKPVGLKIGSGFPQRQATRPDAKSVATRARAPLAVPSISFAVALVAVFGVVLGVNNSRLRAYDLVAQATGEPKLASYLADPGTPAGWSPTFATEYDWAKPFFGETSQWFRYFYSPTIGGDLRSSLPITADVINTDNLSSFSSYGVEACYRFHGYSLRDVVQTNLGGGITGQALSYTTKDQQDWSIVYWIWPVKQGTSTRYERVILYLLDDVNGSSGATQTVDAKLRGSLNPGNATEMRLLATRAFLVSFAREVVIAQTKIAPGTQLRANNTVAASDSPLRRLLEARAKAAGVSSTP